MAVQKAMADSLALLNEKAPNDQVIKLKALEAMQKVADGKATKIIIPSELQFFRYPSKVIPKRDTQLPTSSYKYI